VNLLLRHLASAAPTPHSFLPAARFLVFTPVRFVLAPLPPMLQLPPVMAPPQPIVVLDPLSRPRSMVTPFALNERVNGGLLAPNVERAPPVWIVPPATDPEPNPPYGYVVSFVQLHERGFNASESRFMRGLCYHYVVELHNFAPTDFAGGHLRWRLRGVLGDPSELGSLGAPLPR
jgi:hypothetical protein